MIEQSTAAKSKTSSFSHKFTPVCALRKLAGFAEFAQICGTTPTRNRGTQIVKIKGLYKMKKSILLILTIIIFSLFSVPCFSSESSDDPYVQKLERRMKKKLLKCKDVVDVDVKMSWYWLNAKVCVQLTDNRYLEFRYVKSNLKNEDVEIRMIGNIVPLNITYKISGKGGIDCHEDHLRNYSINLENLHFYLKKIKSVQDIINNYQEVYEFIQKLGDFPQDFNGKTYEISDSSLKLFDWKSYKSDFYYYDSKQRQYNKFFKISKTDYNDFVKTNISKENHVNFIRWNYFEESEPAFSVK